MVMAGVSAIACGYEDANDLDRLRQFPLMKLAVGRCPQSGGALVSQSTICRLANAPRETEAATAITIASRRWNGRWRRLYFRPRRQDRQQSALPYMPRAIRPSCAPMQASSIRPAVIRSLNPNRADLKTAAANPDSMCYTPLRQFLFKMRTAGGDRWALSAN
jgi:hypothetical protein